MATLQTPNYIHPSANGTTIGTQSDGTVIVSSEININTGRAKGIGSSSTLLSNLGVSNFITSLYGSRVVTKTDERQKALSTGTFAFTVGSIIRRVTLSLSGVSNTVLQSGASGGYLGIAFGRRAINQVVSVRSILVATGIRAGNWTAYNGAWDSGPTAQNDFDAFVTQAGDGGDGSEDNAANPTYAKPGELVYRDGSPEPIQADYSAKTT